MSGRWRPGGARCATAWCRLAFGGWCTVFGPVGGR
eukprot:ctg_6664.g859